MAFEHGEHGDPIGVHAVDNPKRSQERLANIVTLELGYATAGKGSGCGELSGVTQSLHPTPRGAWLVGRDVLTDRGKVCHGSLGPTNHVPLFRERSPNRASRISPTSSCSTTLPALAWSIPSRTAATNLAWRVSRSNSLGESSTAAALPFCVMTRGLRRPRRARILSERWAFNSAIGTMSSATCHALDSYFDPLMSLNLDLRWRGRKAARIESDPPSRQSPPLGLGTWHGLLEAVIPRL
jgi:hypothetical protein